MTENEARQMEVEIEWNGKTNVCTNCGKVPETYYVVTGHDHTDDEIRYCFCRSVTPTIEQLQARVAELATESSKWKSLTEASQRVAESAQRRADKLTAEVERLKEEKRYRYVEQILSPIRILLKVARAAESLANDFSEIVDGDDGLVAMVQQHAFDELSDALDLLDELPDDKPGYVLGGAAKARWALHELLDEAESFEGNDGG